MIEQENIQTMYIWKLIHVMHDGQYEEIVNWGCREECIEMFVEDVLPILHTSVDRDMSEMQDEIDYHFPDKRYIFKYEEITIRLDTLEVVN